MRTKKISTLILAIALGLNVKAQTILDSPLMPPKDANGCELGENGQIISQPNAWLPRGVNLITNPCTQGGKVGIGVTNPTESLDVAGNVKVTGNITAQTMVLTNSGSALNIPNGSLLVGDKLYFNDFNTYITQDASGMRIQVNNASLVFSPQGRMGINTTTPQAKIHLVAPSSGSGDLLALNRYNTNGVVESRFRVTDLGGMVANGLTTINVSTANEKAISIVQRSGGSSKEVFNVSGAGVVKCTELVVQVAPFPDYVFEKNYKLMSLLELEDYINQNKRLPNVPSASEIESKGLDVGEILRIQQEKIEELTLYILGLHDKVKLLERGRKKDN